MGLRNLEFNIKKTNSLDENGFMTIEGVAAIADKPMEYIDYWNDKVTKEIIPLEELEKSQELIVGIPVTNGHPWEFVDNKNAGDYVKGTVIENLGIVDKELRVKAKIYDGELILDIQNGKDKLSIGYYCDMEETSGITENGENYTHIQRNIKYNHLGIVYEPRAGEEAKITKFNSKDKDLAFSKGLNIKKINGSDEGMTFKLNGKDMTEQEIYAEAIRLNSENATLKAEKSRIEGELAVEKQNCQDALAKVNGMEEEITRRVNSRLELISTVKENGISIENIEKMNELDIKKSVIKQNSTIDIEGKDENFIEGVYQALVKNNAKDPIPAVEKQNSNGGTDIAQAYLSSRGGK